VASVPHAIVQVPLLREDERSSLEIRVPSDVLRGGVEDHVGSEDERVLEDRRRERVVDDRHRAGRPNDRERRPRGP
jgi:hypothetical protein